MISRSQLISDFLTLINPHLIVESSLIASRLLYSPVVPGAENRSLSLGSVRFPVVTSLSKPVWLWALLPANTAGKGGKQCLQNGQGDSSRHSRLDSCTPGPFTGGLIRYTWSTSAVTYKWAELWKSFLRHQTCLRWMTKNEGDQAVNFKGSRNGVW